MWFHKHSAYLSVLICLQIINPLFCKGQEFEPTPSSRARSLELRAASQLLSGTDTLPLDDCQHLAIIEDQLFNQGLYQLDYDTIKAYVAQCYYIPNAYGSFSGAEGDVDALDSLGPVRYDEFREWLKSVLYLRVDTNWYCADVNQIVHSFLDYTGHGLYQNGAEAVVRYIVDHQRCDSEWTAFMTEGDNYPQGILMRWRDTVKDSFTEAGPDTTVPSIDSIGLSILRGPQYAGIKETLPPEGTQEVTGLMATENPFTNATGIKFDLAEYGLVTFQLYDLLGNPVTTNGIGQVLYPGAHEFDIDGTKLAPGTYIARVAFHDGDVESIKLVKQ